MHPGIKWISVLVLTFILAGTVNAEMQRISVSPGDNEIRLIEQTDQGLLFEVNVGELTALEITTPEGVFSSLLLPGFHRTHEYGEPALPMVNRLVEIPYGATAEIEIVGFDTQVVRLSDVGVLHPLMPAQPSVSKSADPATLPFLIDRAVYERAGEYSRELVKIVDTGQLRSARISRVEVSPVSYNPVEGLLTIRDNIRFYVRYPGADYERDAYEKARTYSPFFDVVYSRIAGYRGYHEAYPDHLQGPAKYIIVSDRMFEATLQPFVGWKTEQGFEVIEAYTDVVGSTTSAIQAYIHDLYNSATPEEPAPTFVLFVGDVNLIPAYNISGVTDRPYCDVTGDMAPEMYYGRFSARTLAELTPQIDKTIEYEKLEMPDPSYLGEVVLIAGVDSYYASSHGNGQINYGTQQYFNAEHGILSHTYLYPASGSSGNLIRQNVSDGVAFVNYTAHGWESGWADPSFTISDINNLNNVGKYCLAVGNCCLTSAFGTGDCFAEHWLRIADKGAIGYIGGANNTYWDEDYWWGVGYGTISGSGVPYESTGLGAYDGAFHDHGEAIDQWYVVQDALIFCGNLAVQESGSGQTSYYWNIYNLMGDPSLSPHMGVPADNTISHAAVLSADVPWTDTEFQITAEPNSYVGLTKDGVLIGCGLVGETGELTLICNGQGESGVAKLVVTCHNRIPYITDIPIETAASADGVADLRVQPAGSSPNPFSPRTTLSFTLRAQEHVTLAIHDAQGRKVRLLTEADLPSGRHQIQWDGRDDSGHLLPGGVYLANLVTASRSENWKMILAR